MSELKVTLVKSSIGQCEKMKGRLLGMGLTKREKTVVLKDTPEVRGMIAKVAHLVRVEE
ncbi:MULTISPECIES: 50S ribosomal protein L30 [Geomonas]|uniref:50S ribosomal protein L30 n=3 Tax=Geomonas TaxID=2651583 RepID=A0ABS0YID9_9BACT|nr:MULTISPECIES: 50S ribosomal protein L30 [Geomonas]MBJ6752016.1 50S ribosomal protein L30 [Geomonas anaerohicana]MBU5638360.1 50S ribosomal protein L30 [Geomonas diazotrophica]QWV96637.1 50S ribosomal protein L30 [Geomonas nitrogeniifigens]QXE85740.1 50S ribosomal protein L30 [Geomonas nitrogeniifigens]QXE90786.1 50S ribosomal protein L30 [Geomonas subterranea]